MQTFWQKTHVPPPGGILVSGLRGCGKTAVLERTAAYLANHPQTMCHVSRINCRSMAGDKMKRVRHPLAVHLSFERMQARAPRCCDVQQACCMKTIMSNCYELHRH